MEVRQSFAGVGLSRKFYGLRCYAVSSCHHLLMISKRAAMKSKYLSMLRGMVKQLKCYVPGCSIRVANEARWRMAYS